MKSNTDALIGRAVTKITAHGLVSGRIIGQSGAGYTVQLRSGEIAVSLADLADWTLGEAAPVLPDIGSSVVRHVGGGTQRGKVTAHRGDRIAVEFPYGDHRQFSPPFAGLTFEAACRPVEVPPDKIASALAKVLASAST